MYDDEQTTTDLSQVELFKIYQATVLTNVTTLADDLFVTIPQLDTDEGTSGLHKYGPCLGWDKRSDGSYPGNGDVAAVFLDDQGEYWLAAWSPS